MSAETDKQRTRQGRLAAVAIAGSALVSVLGTSLGEKMGLSNRALGLVGLAAMAGFAFGLIVAVRLWLAGRKEG